MDFTTIYAAHKIITMNPSNPIASHVAIRAGRILGVGSLADLIGWGDYKLDERFSQHVFMPGLVEGHSHVMEGTFWRYIYCGYFDRVDPNGKLWRGAKTIDEVIDRLKPLAERADDPRSPITGWSFDPIYFDNMRVTREALDMVSDTRPVGVLHASGHIMTVNTVALDKAKLLRKGIEHDGIPLGEDGFPTGELKGPDAMMPVGIHTGFDRDILAADELGLREFARLCVRKGVTTAADLASLLPNDAVEMMKRVTSEENFPARIVSLRRLLGLTPKEMIERAKELNSESTERLRLGAIKIVADGSIQGFSARLRWPGYYNGAPNGLWYVAPEQLQEMFELALLNNVQVHIHTNGDEATALVLDCMELALSKIRTPDHRFTLQHCQLADGAQFRRMKALGMCVNLFPNHHFYWGDQHYKYTVGPERANRMNACATALRTGVPMAIHSDAPVTPLGPLFTAWCAVNRQTASGRVLGAEEQIEVEEALQTITLGAAYTLKLDGEIGSIETGKRADLTVLEEDPIAVGKDALKDIKIWGTILGGRIFPANDI